VLPGLFAGRKNFLDWCPSPANRRPVLSCKHGCKDARALGGRRSDRHPRADHLCRRRCRRLIDCRLPQELTDLISLIIRVFAIDLDEHLEPAAPPRCPNSSQAWSSTQISTKSTQISTNFNEISNLENGQIADSNFSNYHKRPTRLKNSSRNAGVLVVAS
jgi:hypothetical protein